MEYNIGWSIFASVVYCLPVEAILRDVLADVIGRQVSYGITCFGH